MAKSVASADRSRIPAASSNEKNTWPSFRVIHGSYRGPESWTPPCCGEPKSHINGVVYLQFFREDGRAIREAKDMWMCEECARKHGLLW